MADEQRADVEVRAANLEEFDELDWILRMVFADHAPAIHPSEVFQPEWTTCVFEGGQMATTFVTVPMQMRLNGILIPFAGVTAVGTLPNKRRRGYVRLAMEQSFREQKERGQAIAALWASQSAIYHRFGYGIVSTQTMYDVDPRDVVFVEAPSGAGIVRLSDEPEMDVLEPLYDAFVAHRTGPLERNDALWTRGFGPLRKPPDEEGPLRIAIYEEAGQPLGYAIFTNREYDWGMLRSTQGDSSRPQQLWLRELVALTPGAYVALWQFLASHDLVYRIVAGRMPEDDMLWTTMRDPRVLRRRTWDGLMTRVVDVEKALPLRPYGQAGRFTFELDDELCEWNQGTWTLETDAAGAHVARSDESASVRLSAHGLGPLLFGYHSATELARVGWLDADDPAGLVDWDRAFAIPQRPACLNIF